MKYDVIVVGGGPAGSVTARFAAEAGARVLIVERRPEVGVPVLCGEGISKRIDEFKVLEGNRWIASSMDGARIFSPDGTLVSLAAEFAGDETGYVVHRDVFDKELARGAIRAGAELWLNSAASGLIKGKNDEVKGVKIRQFDEEIEVFADVVVGADGVESKVGRWAGINTTLKPKDLETCAQYTLTNVECDEPFCDFYLGKKVAPGGYVWVFPKGKDVANVGIGILASLSKPGKAKQMLDQFIAKNAVLKKGMPIRFLTGAVSVSEPVENPVCDNLILVGDAARHVDPITGGGLTCSIEGGKIAGEILGEGVQQQCFTKEFLSRYTDGVTEAFYKKLQRNYLVKETLLGFDDKTLNMLAHSLKDYKFDEFNTFGIIKALIAKHPSLLIKLRPLMKLSNM